MIRVWKANAATVDKQRSNRGGRRSDRWRARKCLSYRSRARDHTAVRHPALYASRAIATLHLDVVGQHQM